MPGRSKANLIVLLGYAAVSFAYFGWRLLPHPGRGVLGFGHDSQIYIWSFAWWPHAIGSGANPFVTHALYAPTGINTAWTLSVPGLAVAFSPITALFGPVVSYNLAALLMPALSAWTAYLLCRYLTRSLWASVVGGYLFGFSAAMLRQQLFGHLPVTAVFLLPLVALAVVRHIRGELSARGLAWRLGVLLAAQLWISTEFALTLTIVLALGLVLALWLLPDARSHLLGSLRPIVAGYALGALFAAPFLYFALTGFVSHGFITIQETGSDLLNLVIPTPVIGLGGSSFPSAARRFAPSGSSAYLGLPTLVIVAAFAIRSRQVPGARFLLAATVACAVVVLGADLEVYGRRLVPLPWSAALHVPVLNNALPFRFTAYLSLAAAVIVALWTATARGRIRRCLLPALAVVALVPSVWRTSYPSFTPAKPVRAAFFTDGLYKTCVGRDETVAVFPFGGTGDSLLWQAEAGFWFRMAGDGLQEPDQALTPFDAERIVQELNYGYSGLPTIDRLLAFAARHRVDRVLAAPGVGGGGGYPSRAQMRRFGKVELVGGMLVAPACGEPSLTTRDLTSFVERDPYTEIGSAPNIGWCTGQNFNLIPQGLYPARLLRGAELGIVVDGQGLTCPPPPDGYRRRGLATPDMGVPADTYPYYAP